MDRAPSFAAAGIVLPLTYEGDGTLIDAAGAVACQIDPNCEMDDERVETIANSILAAVNASRFEARYLDAKSQDAGDGPEGTIEALIVCAGMLEQIGPGCFPANEQGQVDFARIMTDSVAAEIRAYVANTDCSEEIVYDRERPR